MKKYIILPGLILFILLQSSIACTTFFINKNGELVFGRNYDWVSGAGMVCTNLRGLEKTSMKEEEGNKLSWVSKYGSITFNQFGKEFPTGGMNERGLVVELMWLDDTKYPKADNRPAFSVLQWIQYQLDNNSTIEEVIATDEKIRLSAQNPPLHYLIADANGNAATIEFLDGKMIVHKGNDLPFPVLTNNTYAQSAKVAKGANIQSGNKNFSIEDNSLLRFTKACSMLHQYQQNEINKPATDYAFHILENVAQENYTKWSIVYDLKHKKIHFRTAGYRDIKSVDFNSFDFTCTSGSKVANMNQDLKGSIDKNFIAFNETMNLSILTTAIEESSDRVQVSDKTKQSILAYTKSTRCK